MCASGKLWRRLHMLKESQWLSEWRTFDLVWEPGRRAHLNDIGYTASIRVFPFRRSGFNEIYWR